MCYIILGMAIRRGQRESRTSPRRIRAAERQVQALELRKAGASFHAIAKALGYTSAYGAQVAVEACLRRAAIPVAEEALKIDAQRLDDLLLAVWQKAKAGELDYWDRALRVIEARARRLGFDTTQHPGAAAAALAQVQVVLQAPDGQSLPLGEWRKHVLEGTIQDEADHDGHRDSPQ